jgi:hypothetical protein
MEPSEAQAPDGLSSARLETDDDIIMKPIIKAEKPDRSKPDAAARNPWVQLDTVLDLDG